MITLQSKDGATSLLQRVAIIPAAKSSVAREIERVSRSQSINSRALL
jgi:hypothetical protein